MPFKPIKTGKGAGKKPKPSMPTLPDVASPVAKTRLQRLTEHFVKRNKHGIRNGMRFIKHGAQR